MIGNNIFTYKRSTNEQLTTQEVRFKYLFTYELKAAC